MEKWVKISHLLMVRVEGADPQKLFTNIGSCRGGLYARSKDVTLYDESLIKRRKSLSRPFKDTIHNALDYHTLRHRQTGKIVKKGKYQGVGNCIT